MNTPSRIEEVPLESVRRPIIPVLDEEKVQFLMKSISEEGLHVPITVLRDSNNGALFGFGGCHRYEAHKRLGKETIKVEVKNATPNMLKLYLGASYSS